jgi:hypothetical protein
MRHGTYVRSIPRSTVLYMYRQLGTYGKRPIRSLRAVGEVARVDLGDARTAPGGDRCGGLGAWEGGKADRRFVRRAGSVGD